MQRTQAAQTNKLLYKSFCRLAGCGTRPCIMHILTAGHYTYISDNRYEARYEENTDTWVLLIRSVQVRDSGLFECQLSSMPVISYFVQLTVLESTVEILGDDDLYVQSGSSHNLTCIIANLPSDSDVIR